MKPRTLIVLGLCAGVCLIAYFVLSKERTKVVDPQYGNLKDAIDIGRLVGGI